MRRVYQLNEYQIADLKKGVIKISGCLYYPIGTFKTQKEAKAKLNAIWAVNNDNWLNMFFARCKSNYVVLSSVPTI